MEIKSFSFGEAPYVVEGVLTLCGQDIALHIGGGTLPHIGAVAVAEPRPSLRLNGGRSADCSVLCMPGHKDDMLAREAATRLAAVTGTRAVVTVGLHVDKVSIEGITILTGNFWQVVDACLGYLV
ncbi:MAG: hypothetical protein ACI3XH_02615 [Phascolarctobacterium sp.]